MLFVTKMVGCIRSCLECLSFGMMEQNVVIQLERGAGERETERKLTKYQNKIAKKLADMDLEINFQALDRFQVKKIGDLLDDYEIVSDVGNRESRGSRENDNYVNENNENNENDNENDNEEGDGDGDEDGDGDGD